MLSPKRKRLKPGEKISLSLPLAQVDLIVEQAYFYDLSPSGTSTRMKLVHIENA